MKLIPWFLLLVCITACKDKYNPDIHLPSSGLLVVEGFINAGTGPTTISLSRTAAIDHIAEIPESGAQIEVQSEPGVSYPLSEDTIGAYSINQLSLDSSQKYRLHIKTSDGKEYLSDFSEVRKSKPIDSVGWKAGSDKLMIYISTHDDQNKSLYYQWNYEETWLYNSDRTELPPVQVYSGYEICSMDTVPNMQWPLVYYFGNGYGVPIMPYEQAAFILGSLAGCVDCRIQGGTTVKPDFWH